MNHVLLTQYKYSADFLWMGRLYSELFEIFYA
jgi:hypothetical protein